jgi:hypothetical protein
MRSFHSSVKIYVVEFRLVYCIVVQEIGPASEEPSSSGYTLCSVLALAEQAI